MFINQQPKTSKEDEMRNFKVLCVMAASLSLLAACNQTPTDTPVADAGNTTPVASVADSHAGHDHESGAEHDSVQEAAPSEITLEDGSTIPVIAVAALNSSPKDYSGTFAIDGTIGDVFADKGRFMLRDNGVACGDKSCSGCEADQQLPVNFDLASFEGGMPAKESRVLVVADIKPSEAGGFTLAVKEVREGSGDKVICTSKDCGHDHGTSQANKSKEDCGEDCTHDNSHEKKAKDASSQA
jgi:hypothetical protein